MCERRRGKLRRGRERKRRPSRQPSVQRHWVFTVSIRISPRPQVQTSSSAKTKTLPESREVVDPIERGCGPWPSIDSIDYDLESPSSSST